jgi:hypothetical protein
MALMIVCTSYICVDDGCYSEYTSDSVDDSMYVYV